jgi:AraC-like DNA-binding protein
MSILYLNEHCSCFNYCRGEQATISIRAIPAGGTWEISPVNNALVFVLEGELQFSYKKKTNKVVQSGKIMLLTSDVMFKAQANKDTQIVVVRMPVNIQLCDWYSFERLLQEVGTGYTEFTLLDIRNEMKSFLDTLVFYINSGIKCTVMFDMKVKELFYVFRGFYPKEELYAFFYPILSNDMTFSDFVQKNYHKVKTVKELAEIANYSLSGFVKRFKKVFGTSAYQWMKEQKAAMIYHEINDMSKSLKEISFDYGFSSPAHFNDFCKVYFGNTPGNIRKNKKNAQSGFITKFDGDK